MAILHLIRVGKILELNCNNKEVFEFLCRIIYLRR
ncbi:Uncharacterised protein [Clostridium disporicum]|nr:Uncharacterised protein [Clostridium disporicum]